jgi:uncharacterized protein (DUF1499 family)
MPSLKKIAHISVTILAILALAYTVRLIYLAQTLGPTAGFGQGKSTLLCPLDKPNCVSSANTEPTFAAAQFRVNGETVAMMAQLKRAIATEPRAEIVFESPSRLDVVFTSALFRYRDDAAFQLNPPQHTIDFRSKSRVGHSDLGVNRDRIERLRTALGGQQ